jgi:hypothetical protein
MSPMDQRYIPQHFQPYHRMILLILSFVARVILMPLTYVAFKHFANPMTLAHRERRVSRVFRIAAMHFSCYTLT